MQLKSIICLALLLCANSAFAQTNVTIQNPSFETTNTMTPYTCNGTNGGVNTGPIPNWTATGNGDSGSFQPGACSFASVPDGSTIAYTNGPTLSQDLGVAVLASKVYTASVKAGRRLDCCTATSTIQLLAGTTVLCSASLDTSTLTAGAFAILSCNYTSPSSPPSGDLTVALGLSSGVQSDFDSVSVSYTSTAHQAVLTWTDSINPSGTAYNIYRTAGTATYPVTCNTFTKLNSSPISPKTYTDATIVSGQMYCWEVRAINGSTESIAGDSLFIVVQ